MHLQDVWVEMGTPNAPRNQCGAGPPGQSNEAPQGGWLTSIAVHGSWGLIGPKQQFLTGGDLVTSSCGEGVAASIRGQRCCSTPYKVGTTPTAKNASHTMSKGQG